MVLLIAMCVVVVVVVVMVLVVKVLQLLLLENGYVLEAQHLSERLQRTSATGWTPVAPALAGSLWRQHWLEACGATHSLLAGPAAPAPAAPAALTQSWLRASASFRAMTARGPAHGPEGFFVILC